MHDYFMPLCAGSISSFSVSGRVNLRAAPDSSLDEAASSFRARCLTLDGLFSLSPDERTRHCLQARPRRHGGGEQRLQGYFW